YTPDGTSFLTVSDVPAATEIRRYRPSMATLPPRPSGTVAPPAQAEPSGLAGIPPWYGLIAAGGGLAIAVAGFVGLRRSRRVQPPLESSG
ncbi:MAG TPA: hypothetical protein VF163_12595, partial [Micromonosporaceae bacterium]